MPGKRSFEDQLAALDALRQQPAAAAIEPLRKALAHRNNYVVARSADLVREFALTDLTAELLSAYDRFFTDPVKTDPQCWAKNALSRALATFEHQEPAVFLRGMRHIQNEPVWGGRSDTAGTLRATCALALVQCRSLSETELLNHLIELFDLISPCDDVFHAGTAALFDADFEPGHRLALGGHDRAHASGCRRCQRQNLRSGTASRCLDGHGRCILGRDRL